MCGSGAAVGGRRCPRALGGSGFREPPQVAPRRLPHALHPASPHPQPPDLPSQARRVCALPSGHRFFPLTMAVGDVSNCSQPLAFPANWTAVSQTPLWTDSQQAAK